MTGYTAIPDSDIDPESPGTTTLFTRLRDNPIAISEGTSPAPAIQEAALDSSIVSQGKLKSTYGDVSVYVNANEGKTGTLPGGGYAFRILIKWASSPGVYDNFNGYVDYNGADTTFIAPQLSFEVDGPTGSNTGYGREYYIQASPPYDLGDGEVGQFIFALIDNGTGLVEKTYSAQDAPWHNNGPTNIAADYYDKEGRGWKKRRVKGKNELVEITQEVKQADMEVIPHPFIGHDLTGKTVVLIDPVSDLSWELRELQEKGECICELLHERKLIVDNAPLVRATPKDVMAVTAKWKNSK